MIVKKDFSLDPEESRTRTAAHHMARNITAGMAMITCKEPLQQSLNNHIKSNLMATLRVNIRIVEWFIILNREIKGRFLHTEACFYKRKPNEDWENWKNIHYRNCVNDWRISK